MNTDRLPDLKIVPDVLSDIYADATRAVDTLLDGFYKDETERNDTPHGRVKFELLYLRQQLAKKNLPVPCYVTKTYSLSTIEYNYVEGLHPRGSTEAHCMETILKCLDFGCREIRKDTPERIPQVLRVLDWFCAVFRKSVHVLPGSADEAMLQDIEKIGSLIAQGVVPPFDRSKFPGFDYGKEKRLRSTPKKGGNDFIYEGYLWISDCIERRFIPLMPWDIGNRYIFMYSSLGQYDPLDPPDFLRKLENVDPLSP